MGAAASNGMLPWLDDLPEGWEVVKARRVFRERKRTGFADKPLLSVTQENGVVTREESKLRVWNPGSDISGYKLVLPRDFVISLRSFQGGLERSEIEGLVSPAYTPFYSTKLDEPRVDFLRHYFKSGPFISSLQPLTSGIRQGKNISFVDFGESQLPIPPVEEAGAIASFLDRETARIDTLITKMLRLLDLLQEMRTALITRTVTRGLDPEVRLKDSGVEWIGEIPDHWEMVRLPWVVAFREGPGILAKDFRDEGVPLIRIGNLDGAEVNDRWEQYLDPARVSAQWSHFQVGKGDLLISASATSGQVSVVTEKADGAVPYTGIIKMRPSDAGLSADFLRFFLASQAFLQQVMALRTGVSIQHFGPTHLRRVQLSIPPLEEQRELTDEMGAELRRLDRLRRRIDRGVALLQEYRTAVISSAVTGDL